MAKVVTKTVLIHEFRIFPTDGPVDIINALQRVDVRAKLDGWDLDGSDGKKDFLVLRFIEERNVNDGR